MIRLVFTRGGTLRRVIIEGKKITFMTEELGYKPFEIDLSKLDEPEMKKKIEESDIDKKELKELQKLDTEDELANDIKKDWQRDGWKLFKRIKREWE